MNRQTTSCTNSTADESRFSVEKKKPFPLLPPQVTDPTERKKRAEGWGVVGWGGGPESRLLEAPVNTQKTGTSQRKVC